MLDNHQRAAWITNAPNVAWHHFLQSRFVGRLPARDGGTELALVVQAIAQQNPTHADLQGTMEYGPSISPVIFDFIGSLDIEYREVVIREPHSNPPDRSYTGQISENGRVITLQAGAPGGRASKPIYLIHEGTLAEFL